jgi:low affinity Fe/Cu permease
MSSSPADASSHSSSGLSAWFSHFAGAMAKAVGHPAAFIMAVGFVIAWAITGPFFGFSDTWQLIINTTTTIITSLIVFLIQNTQNRDTAALQLKIDELIRATKGAHNAVLDLEELEEGDLTRIRDRYEELAREPGTNGRASSTRSARPSSWSGARMPTRSRRPERASKHRRADRSVRWYQSGGILIATTMRQDTDNEWAVHAAEEPASA